MPLDAQVEKVAAAIWPLVRSEGGMWTAKAIATLKWPKDFSERERNDVRAIALRAIEALSQEQ